MSPVHHPKALGLVARTGLGLVLALPFAVSQGCASDPSQGYSFASTYDTSVRTVAVPVFDNQTHSTGLEAWLTDAIVKKIQSSTPWKVTTSEYADTVLSGSIEQVRLGRLSRTIESGLAQEQPIAITVDFSWRDSRSGEVLASRQRFRATSTFVPSQGVEGEPGERIEIGERDAIAELADAIVEELRSNW